MSVRRSRKRKTNAACYLKSRRLWFTLGRMATRRIFDAEQHAQFVTFSCFRRRRLLDHAGIRDRFVTITAEKLREHRGICTGFVVMPDHVHAIVWFGAAARSVRS